MLLKCKRDCQSRIDEINVAEIEAGLTKRRFAEMEVGLMKLLLLKWMLEG